MGFDERRIPKVYEAMRDGGHRVTGVVDPSDVSVVEIAAGSDAPRTLRIDDVACERPFVPHAGWIGHVERGAR
jgi:hypothetical protein